MKQQTLDDTLSEFPSWDTCGSNDCPAYHKYLSAKKKLKALIRQEQVSIMKDLLKGKMRYEVMGFDDFYAVPATAIESEIEGLQK